MAAQLSPRRNRVDPFGDFHAVPERGMFTGNRGCLVDDDGDLVRHHRGRLWIVCAIEFKDWQHPIAAPNTWTPLFFMDEAVALAAGHRPCATCRREAYTSYRDAVNEATGSHHTATDLNDALAAERLTRGRGLDRASNRITWSTQVDGLPTGTVVLDGGVPHLVTSAGLHAFGFDGWADPSPSKGAYPVLTPPTSVAAMRQGYQPVLDESALR